MPAIFVPTYDGVLVAIQHGESIQLNMLGFNNQSGPPTVRIRILKVSETEVNLSKLRDYLKCRVGIKFRSSNCLLGVIDEFEFIQAHIDDLP